jgi:peptidoglycan/xylan/chitin deacetylase (PgdA/CDA1 family)
MRRVTAIAYAFAFCATVSSAFAGECSNPNALGTSRTLVIDNTSHPRLGSQQYNETLPLADHEVVLTFDDGPLAPYSTRILDILASECVKATYFLVGEMAQNNPALVKRIAKEGHTVGTHSRSHPLTFDRMPLPTAEEQIDGGISLVKAALGDDGKLAPFFRIPGLLRANGVENLLASRHLVTWSVDAVADDWHRGITADEIAKRALRRLEARGSGILLLHDIHPATALALPAILRGLKQRGFRIVHVVPADPNHPKTYSEPQQWAAHGKRLHVAVTEGVIDPRRPVPSRASFDIGAVPITDFTPPTQARHVMAAAGDDMQLPRTVWSDEERISIPTAMAPATAGAMATDWPGYDHITAIGSFEDATWPTVKPPPAPEPAKRTAVKNSVRSKHGKSPDRCRGGDRCKKPPIGHQLSLSHDMPPSALRAQYSF